MIITIKSVGFLLLGLVIIASAFFLINNLEFSKQGSVDEELQSIGLYSEAFDGFTIEKKFFDETEQSTKLLYRRDDVVLKISSLDDIGKASADILLSDEIQTINALYANALSPYPGEISDEIMCPEKFKPEFHTRQTPWLNYSYFTLFATDRFTYGACTEDLVKYKSILAWTYCSKKNTFYRFEFFIPIEIFSKSHLDMITSFRC